MQLKLLFGPQRYHRVHKTRSLRRHQAGQGLLCSQSHDRIDARGRPGRDQAGKRRYNE